MRRYGFFSLRRYGGFWDYALDPAVLLSVLALGLSTWGLCACATPDEPFPSPAECAEEACEHLTGCAPITFLWGTGWDWRTREDCSSTMTCGSDPSACLLAVHSLECVGPGADPSASLPSIYAVWEACRGEAPEPGFGFGGGTGVRHARK